MKEYEYSFEVKDLTPYIEYCKKNDYEEISITKEKRSVYENKHINNVIARITTRISNRKKEIMFDCKKVKEKKKELNISTESIPMKVTKDNEKSIKSMLEVMDFYEAADNERIRYIYIKNNVKFEIDDYTIPEMKVVAIEGEKKEVDSVYSEIKNLNL